MASNIQVFVKFKEHAVFAGEEVQCTITFKNVAVLPESGFRPEMESNRQGTDDSTRANVHARGGLRNPRNPRLTATTRTHGVEHRHRATTSLSIPQSLGNSALSPAWTTAGALSPRPSHGNRRSVSIISLGSPNTDNGSTQNVQKPFLRSSSNPQHSRSASYQVLSGRMGDSIDVSSAGEQLLCSAEPPIPTASTVSKTSGSALNSRSASGKNTAPIAVLQAPLHPRAQGLYADSSSPPLSGSQNASRNSAPFSTRRSPSSLSYVPPAAERASDQADPKHDTGMPMPHEPLAKLSQLNKSLIGTSVAGSDRSSGEFQTLSNHSQETLASEQVSLVSERPSSMFPSSRIRQHYKMESILPNPRRQGPEKMLMGYAQISAVFTLDGSLVDQSQFEEVKRKGFVGGQGGGGVVGVKTSQSGRGFLSGFNLNSIGQSFGDLLGGSDMSSTKEMKDVTSARAIPLLSTPQSLLFVDLQLGPLEERSFSFNSTLPQGLPSSHKGKVMKVVYTLIIGVQGASGEKEVRAVRRVSVPFRVFSGVDSEGEIYGHDLMQPHVMLRDMARIETIQDVPGEQREPTTPKDVDTKSSMQSFLTYVDSLLDKSRRRQSSSGTLSASYPTLSTNAGHVAKQTIGRAILFSNQPRSGYDRSSNRFEIARNGLHVAVVVLNRSLHRLGETVTAIIDFSGAQTSTFSVCSSLETTEKVNSSIALRSAASINRVSRKLHASCSENTLYAKRVIFSPSIPASATPTFLTSGVDLDWSLRFEFATIRPYWSGDASKNASLPPTIEAIVKDERGIVAAANEAVQCEMFEVSIPITVYGDIVMDGKESQEIVGLPI